MITFHIIKKFSTWVGTTRPSEIEIKLIIKNKTKIVCKSEERDGRRIKNLFLMIESRHEHAIASFRGVGKKYNRKIHSR